MTAQPTLNLNFAQARFPDPRITFTRASSGTYIDALGRVRTAAANQPRFEFDPVTGQCLGLLIEESRTNLLLWSQAFDKATWGKNRATVVPNAAAAPDGTMTAAKLVEDTSTNSTHDIFQNYAVTGPVTVSVSIYAKAAGRSQFSFRCADPSFIGRAFFNLDTGTLGVKDPAVTSHAIEPVGDGWYRCSATFTTRADGTIANFQIQLSNGAVTYTGDGVSGIYIWGAQLEQGSFPTSYIKTEDAPATRAADTAYVDGEGWLNPAEGTIVVEVREPTGVTATTNLLTLSEGASNMNRYSLQGSGSTLRILRSLGGSTAYADLGSRAPRGQWNRIAFGYSSAGLIAAANGEMALDRTDMTTPDSLSRLYLGGSFAGTAFSWIRKIQYYPVRLPPEELVRITA